MISDIRPGLRVDLIFERDYLKCIESDFLRSALNFFKALVYDCNEKKVIISETAPPLPSTSQGKIVMVTYCSTGRRKMERYGFSAEISESLTGYKIDSARSVNALVLKRKSKPELMNVRLHFRVQPTFGAELALYYRSIKLNIADISLGGAQFSHYDRLPVKAGATIRLKLEIDRKTYELDASVIRVWQSPAAGRSMDHHFVAVRFLHSSRELEQRLSNKIMTLQRELLADCK